MLTHQEILRNVVIREAIEIENLIYIKVQENFTSITPELSNNQLDKIKKPCKKNYNLNFNFIY
jgi:hypothetical protein